MYGEIKKNKNVIILFAILTKYKDKEQKQKHQKGISARMTFTKSHGLTLYRSPNYIGNYI